MKLLYLIISLFLYVSLHAQDSLVKKDYKKIYKSLKLSVVQNPKSIENLIKLADISLILKKEKESKKIYQNILSISNQNREAIKKLAFLYAKEGNIDEARELIKPLRKNFDPIVVYTEALIQINLRNYKRAIYELEEAQKNGLDNLELEKFLVDSYILSNQTSMAELKLSNLIKKYSTDESLFFKKAINHLKIASRIKEKEEKKREIKKAEDALDASLLINAFYVDARYLQSKIYISQNRLENSEKILDSLIEDFPENTQYKYLKSFIYVKKKEFKKAENEFNKILRINPNEFYSRYKAEIFSIENSSPNSLFRLNLSKYRMNRYEINKSFF